MFSEFGHRELGPPLKLKNMLIRPINNQTSVDHANTRLVRYSDGYCTFVYSDLMPFNLKVLKALLYV